MRRKSLGVVLFTLVLVACGGGESSDLDPDAAVLQITSEGGFVPVEFALSNGPRYTVLGDGRLIFQGVQTMEFPGPLVPPYMVAQLDDSQLNAVLAMVEDMGLADIVDESDDSALNFVADASTEVIRFWDDNGEHKYSVYALGIQEEPTERNATFLELIETLDRFTAEAPAEPYEAEEVRVVAGYGFVDPEFSDEREWPLEEEVFADWTELPNGWYCRTYEPEVMGSFEDATQATVWTHPDGTSDPLTLLVRPLIPGETACG